MNPSTCTFKSAHIRGVFDFIQLLYLSLSIYICIYEYIYYIYIYICICTNSYLYPRGVWCVVHGYLRADSGRAIRDAATSAAHERMMGRAGRAWAPFLETLAEYENNYQGLSLPVLTSNTGGYGFIEFEISSSTISTVFRQPLIPPPQARSDSSARSAPSAARLPLYLCREWRDVSPPLRFIWFNVFMCFSCFFFYSF